MFTVYQDDKTADRRGYPYLSQPCWDNSSFLTMLEAVSYAKDWMGEMDIIPNDWDGAPIKFYESEISIKEE